MATREADHDPNPGDQAHRPDRTGEPGVMTQAHIGGVHPVLPRDEGKATRGGERTGDVLPAVCSVRQALKSHHGHEHSDDPAHGTAHQRAANHPDDQGDQSGQASEHVHGDSSFDRRTGRVMGTLECIHLLG